MQSKAVLELLGDSGDARRRYAKHGQRYRRLASASCRPRAGHADDAERRLVQHGAACVVETGEVSDRGRHRHVRDIDIVADIAGGER